MLRSLAAITNKQVKLFVPLSRAIERVRSELSHEYEYKYGATSTSSYKTTDRYHVDDGVDKQRRGIGTS